MFERFSKPARHAVRAACEAADRLGQARVRPEHVLLGVAGTEDGLGARVLAGFGLDTTALERALTRRDRQALLTDDEVAALRSVGIDADEVFRRLEEAFGDPSAWATVDAQPPGQRPVRWYVGSRFEKEAADVLRESLRAAVALKHRQIGTEHLLLGLLAIPRPPLADLLTAHGLTYQVARGRVLEAIRTVA